MENVEMVQAVFPPQPGHYRGRQLSEHQVDAIRTAMRLFVEDDLAQGRRQDSRLYCDACEHGKPAIGSIRYGRYQICNDCATEYELAHARGLVGSVGQFVRDRQFGERHDFLVDSDIAITAG